MLSRERATVFTQTSSDSSIDLKPDFVFKGKGTTRTKLNPPSGIKFQWSESGSYRIDQLKQTIMNLPNRFNPFTSKDFAIYVLHDYAVHLMPEVRKLHWEAVMFLCSLEVVLQAKYRKMTLMSVAH